MRRLPPGVQLAVVTPPSRVSSPTMRRHAARPNARWVPYLFLSPYAVVTAGFFVYPLAYSTLLAFYQTNGPRSKTYVGLDNFRFIFDDPDFAVALRNTFVFAFASVFVQLPLSLALAMLLNASGDRFKSLFRLAIFAPNFVGQVFVGILFLMLFTPRHGLFNQMLQLLIGWGLEEQWLADPALVMPAVVICSLWIYVGFNMIYFLAALQGVDSSLLEAARIDGAGPRAVFWNVTRPAILPVATFVCVTSTIGSFNLFELPYTLLSQTPGPKNSGLFVVTYLYQYGFDNGDLGMAAAVAWVIAALILAASVAQIAIAGRGTEDELNGVASMYDRRSRDRRPAAVLLPLVVGAALPGLAAWHHANALQWAIVAAAATCAATLVLSPGRASSIARTTVLLAVCAVMLMPFAWLIAAAFKDRAVLNDFAFLPPPSTWRSPSAYRDLGGQPTLVRLDRAVPDARSVAGGEVIAGTLNLDNFRTLFLPRATLKGPVTFGRYILNSLFLASAGTVISLTFSSLGGYALAKYEFAGKRPLLAFMLASLAVPGVLFLAPNFQLIWWLGWMDSYAALLVPGAVSVFGIFLFRQAMLDVPNELIEAGRIDGCGECRIYAQLVMPLVRPMTAAYCLINFLGAWNAFIGPNIYLQTQAKLTLPVILNQYVGEYEQQYGVFLAGTLLAIVPPAVLFLALQREFIGGLQSGALKQ